MTRMVDPNTIVNQQWDHPDYASHWECCASGPTTLTASEIIHCDSPSNQQQLTRWREECHLWRVPSVDWLVVVDVDLDWSTVTWFLGNANNWHILWSTNTSGGVDVMEKIWSHPSGFILYWLTTSQLHQQILGGPTNVGSMGGEYATKLYARVCELPRWVDVCLV